MFTKFVFLSCTFWPQSWSFQTNKTHTSSNFGVALPRYVCVRLIFSYPPNLRISLNQESSSPRRSFDAHRLTCLSITVLAISELPRRGPQSERRNHVSQVQLVDPHRCCLEGHQNLRYFTRVPNWIFGLPFFWR